MTYLSVISLVCFAWGIGVYLLFCRCRVGGRLFSLAAAFSCLLPWTVFGLRYSKLGPHLAWDSYDWCLLMCPVLVLVVIALVSAHHAQFPWWAIGMAALWFPLSLLLLWLYLATVYGG